MSTSAAVTQDLEQTIAGIRQALQAVNAPMQAVNAPAKTASFNSESSTSRHATAYESASSSNHVGSTRELAAPVTSAKAEQDQLEKDIERLRYEKQQLERDIAQTDKRNNYKVDRTTDSHINSNCDSSTIMPRPSARRATRSARPETTQSGVGQSVTSTDMQSIESEQTRMHSESSTLGTDEQSLYQMYFPNGPENENKLQKPAPRILLRAAPRQAPAAQIATSSDHCVNNGLNLPHAYDQHMKRHLLNKPAQGMHMGEPRASSNQVQRLQNDVGQVSGTWMPARQTYHVEGSLQYSGGMLSDGPLTTNLQYTDSQDVPKHESRQRKGIWQLVPDRPIERQSPGNDCEYSDDAPSGGGLQRTNHEEQMVYSDYGGTFSMRDLQTPPQTPKHNSSRDERLLVRDMHDNDFKQHRFKTKSSPPAPSGTLRAPVLLQRPNVKQKEIDTAREAVKLDKVEPKTLRAANPQSKQNDKHSTSCRPTAQMHKYDPHYGTEGIVNMSEEHSVTLLIPSSCQALFTPIFSDNFPLVDSAGAVWNEGYTVGVILAQQAVDDLQRPPGIVRTEETDQDLAGEGDRLASEIQRRMEEAARNKRDSLSMQSSSALLNSDVRCPGSRRNSYPPSLTPVQESVEGEEDEDQEQEHEQEEKDQQESLQVVALSSEQALNVDPQEELIKKYLTYGSPPLQAEPGPSDQLQPQPEESKLLPMHAARPAKAVRSAAPLPSAPQETDLFTPHASGIVRPASLPGDYILQSQGSMKGSNEEDQHAQLRSRMEAVESKLQERQSALLYARQHEQAGGSADVANNKQDTDGNCHHQPLRVSEVVLVQSADQVLDEAATKHAVPRRVSEVVSVTVSDQFRLPVVAHVPLSSHIQARIPSSEHETHDKQSFILRDSGNSNLDDARRSRGIVNEHGPSTSILTRQDNRQIGGSPVIAFTPPAELNSFDSASPNATLGTFSIPERPTLSPPPSQPMTAPRDGGDTRFEVMGTAKQIAPWNQLVVESDSDDDEISATPRPDSSSMGLQHGHPHEDTSCYQEAGAPPPPVMLDQEITDDLFLQAMGFSELEATNIGQDGRHLRAGAATRAKLPAFTVKYERHAEATPPLRSSEGLLPDVLGNIFGLRSSRDGRSSADSAANAPLIS